MEKRATTTKRSPKLQNPVGSWTRQARQKIALTRRTSRGQRPQKREPVQLIEMLPIPRTETRPPKKKQECKKALKKTNGGG